MTTEITKLRSLALPGELKELSIDEIQSRIHEFFLITMSDNSIGCFRIFVPESLPHVLELWSVKSEVHWIWRIIVSHAEYIAREKWKQIIAITGNSYTKTVQKSWWIDATSTYPERMAESIQDKKLWLYPKL
jgi:hypothetical protein